MSALQNFSLRLTLATPPRDAGDVLAKAKAMTRPNASIANAITLGAQKLVFQAQKERFTGQGPFPVSEHRLGVVTGRLRRDLHAENAEILSTGYSIRMGSNVEYFGTHERGFSGTVQVPAHTRGAYTVKRREQQRTSKSGKAFSVRANQYSVLPASVRAHSKKMNVPARAPLRTAIEQHGPSIIGGEISDTLKTL